MRAIRKTVFEGIFPHQDRIRTITGLLGFYQKSGLQTVIRKVGFMKLFPDNLSAMEKVLPSVPSKKEMAERADYLGPIGLKTLRVGFFSGCLMDTMFLNTNNSTLKLLQLAGCEIVIPKEQACCGALHGHSGEKQRAKEMAKKNILAFEQLKLDYIITNAGGCGAFLIDYSHLLKDEAEWKNRAQAFTDKIKDITEILVDLDFHKKTELKLSHQIVTYQDSCHLKNVMKTFNAPRLLLQAIKGIEFIEMKDAGSCCGSAGIYNIVESEMSMIILDAKMEHTKATLADTVVTANPGCLLQMKLGIEREGLSDQVNAVHIADLLLEAVTTA